MTLNSMQRWPYSNFNGSLETLIGSKMWKKPSFFWLGKVFNYDKLYIASIKTENAQVTYLQKPQMKIKSWMRVTCNCAYSHCKGTLRKVNCFCRSNFESNSNFVVTLNFFKKTGTQCIRLYKQGGPAKNETSEISLSDFLPWAFTLMTMFVCY